MNTNATTRTTCKPLTDRVREHTKNEINTYLDQQTEARIYGYAARSKEEITQRINELDREWDMERLLQTNASTLSLVGLGMSALHSKKWLLLPGVVFSFFLQHGVQGWCPPLPVFRRLGVRTQQEIAREKYALKVLRGDFDRVSSESDSDTTAETVLGAVGS